MTTAVALAGASSREKRLNESEPLKESLALKRWLCCLGPCVLAGLFVAGCSKSSKGSDQSAGASEPPSAAAVALGDASHGEQIFAQNCASCHGGNGVGGDVGPSLRDEKSRKGYQAAIAWIEDPKSPMPKLYPLPLSLKNVEDVAAYIQTL